MKPNWFGAGIVAGIALFIWSFLSHMVLGLGEAGMSGLATDSPVLMQLQQGLAQPGFYVFPFERDQLKMEHAYATRPHGVLIYTPSNGRPFQFAVHLIIQFVVSLVCGWIAAWIIFAAGPMSFSQRLCIVTAMGLFTGVIVFMPFWNWYGMPLGYTLAQLVEHLIDGAVLGGVIGWMAGSPGRTVQA